MSQFDLEIQADTVLEEPLLALVEEAAVSTLVLEQIQPPVGLSILLTDDGRLRQLNRDFRGWDEPTDVLSFPSGDQTPGMTSYLGDIAISVSAARRQAVESGHSTAAELQLLTVHAVLHLLGYDHAEPLEMKAMWAAQSNVLKKLGVEMGALAISR